MISITPIQHKITCVLYQKHAYIAIDMQSRICISEIRSHIGIRIYIWKVQYHIEIRISYWKLDVYIESRIYTHWRSNISEVRCAYRKSDIISEVQYHIGSHLYISDVRYAYPNAKSDEFHVWYFNSNGAS